MLPPYTQPLPVPLPLVIGVGVAVVAIITAAARPNAWCIANITFQIARQ